MSSLETLQELAQRIQQFKNSINTRYATQKQIQNLQDEQSVIHLEKQL